MSKYLLTNTNNHSFLAIGSSEANLKTLYPNLDIWYKPQGCLFTISDADFEALNLNAKQFESITDGAVVLSDVTYESVSESDMESTKTVAIGAIDKALSTCDFSNNSTFETAINNYKTALNNWDLSTVTFPVSKSLEKAFEDAGLGTAIGINHIS